MDQARRERIGELIRTLRSAQEQVQYLWNEEDRAFENRSLPSQKTESGQISTEAMDDLVDARDLIDDAIELMQRATGDDSAGS